MAGKGALGAALSAIGGAAVTAGKLGYEEEVARHAEEAKMAREQRLAEIRHQYGKEESATQIQAAKEASATRFGQEKELARLRGEEERKTAATRLNEPKAKDVAKEREIAIEAFQAQDEFENLDAKQKRAALAEIEAATSSGKSTALAAVRDIGTKYFKPKTEEAKQGMWSRLTDWFTGKESTAPAAEAAPAPAQAMPTAMSEAEYRTMYKQKAPNATPQQLEASLTAMKAAGRVK